jgi:outer membrane protein assembly factor BamD (BamD/ComL family)
LDKEVSLLRGAQQALSRGDAQGALRLLAQHQALYRKGTLAVERNGMRAIALCQSGKQAQGRVLAERFIENHPQSTLASRVRTACGR